MGTQEQPDGRPRVHRPIATIRSELDEIERHLREVPPHHTGGTADLAARADALRRELAAARDERDRARQRHLHQSQQAQQ